MILDLYTAYHSCFHSTQNLYIFSKQLLRKSPLLGQKMSQLLHLSEMDRIPNGPDGALLRQLLASGSRLMVQKQ
jgi:hypothetical protein